MKQTINNTYPPDLTVGINMFFINTNIIKHQSVDGEKSPLFRFFENTKQVQDGKRLNTSTTFHKLFTELQFTTLITKTIEKIQIELMFITGQKVPFVGTSLVALTFKFRKFHKWNNTRLTRHKFLISQDPRDNCEVVLGH